MRLMREATTTSKVDYFRLPRPLWRKLKKHLPRKKSNKSKKLGGRPRVSDRAVANAIWASSAGYTTHIKVNPRKKDSTEPSGQSSREEDSHGEPHPARRWVVERTISWLAKRRSLRTRWSKKAENWLALIQLACAHILLNLAVFG